MSIIMWVTRFTGRGLRRFDTVEWQPKKGLNIITGNNGAGKTSLLEGLHILSYGKSFRGRIRDGIIQHNNNAVELFIEWQQTISLNNNLENSTTYPLTQTTRKVGLRHSGNSWEGRLDGEKVTYLGDLCAALAVITFEPNSHDLISGASELRRRFMDWGLFHVEPEFLLLWRRYSRALKQRNALLKMGANKAQLDSWDYELAETGEPITRYRQRYWERLSSTVEKIAAIIAPSLEITHIDFSPGWRRHDYDLKDALLLARERDIQQGHTSVGAHRADWNVNYQTIFGREALSRGQEKLTALACLLAQAQDMAEIKQDFPIISLDDLTSELDVNHQEKVMEWLFASQAQVFITATEVPRVLENMAVEFSRFHVEHDGVLSCGLSFPP